MAVGAGVGIVDGVGIRGGGGASHLEFRAYSTLGPCAILVLIFIVNVALLCCCELCRHRSVGGFDG